MTKPLIYGDVLEAGNPSSPFYRNPVLDEQIGEQPDFNHGAGSREYGWVALVGLAVALAGVFFLTVVL